MIGKIKKASTELTKAVDEFVGGIAKTAEVVEMRDKDSLKRNKIVEIRESELKEKEEALTKERNLIEKEKENNYDKQKSLERKEKKLTNKMNQVQKLLEE